MRPGPCQDAWRLGRVLAGLIPDEPKVHGVVALVQRRGPQGSAQSFEFEPAASLTGNQREQRLLLRRAHDCAAR